MDEYVGTGWMMHEMFRELQTYSQQANLQDSAEGMNAWMRK
jgi:hypothetical protein